MGILGESHGNSVVIMWEFSSHGNPVDYRYNLASILTTEV